MVCAYLFGVAWVCFRLSCGFNAQFMVFDTKEYWDTSDAAGPASRPQSGYDGPAPTLQICALTETELVLLKPELT